MLKNWSIKNFKSFKELPSVDLSMVNVLAGANSSGKSTLIQSILLLKQTLQYGAEDRPVNLNGPLLRLGSFRDVFNNDTVEEELSIAFDIDVLPNEISSVGKPYWARSTNYSFQTDATAAWRQISLALTFGVPEDQRLADLYVQERNLTPNLFRSLLKVSGTVEGELRRQIWDFHLTKDGSWPYRIEIDKTTELEITQRKPESEIEGGMISYFLPEVAVVKYNQTEIDVSGLVDSMFRSRNTLLGHGLSSDDSLSSEVVSLINEWLLAHDSDTLDDTADPVLASQAQALLGKFSRPNLMGGLLQAIPNNPSIAADLERLKTTIKNAILSERQVEYRFAGERSRGMSYAVNYLADFFRFGVRYLGPLRDSPRPVYQPEALESTTDVGYRGEHTAAVFEINKKTIVTYRRPPSSDTEESYVATAIEAENWLEEAAAEWLTYLGVASSVETLDAGVFGNRMRVSIEGGDRLHDLTNVGVGVSQVLPIVVMALLAPRGSLLIFEQPELHLHPKVQARLADFFLALAVDGKQTLLETHSEYLVDRLRLRIAMSPADDVRPLVNMLFSEKRAGCSQLTPVEISEYGAILNWPTDFFEQSQRDVSRIIQAASKKRKSQPRQR